MDKIIGKYDCVPFGELNYCYKEGILYQRDMSVSIEYGDEYFKHYVDLEDSDVAVKLNQGRVALSHRYCKSILDMGVGSGEFIKKSHAVMYGYDVNPVAISWLKEKNIWLDPYEGGLDKVDGITLWDTLEHIPQPTQLLDLILPGQFVFISLPIFSDLMKVRFSKHYKPNEHYYYWTVNGMITYMNDMNFEPVEISDQETKAGRQDIIAFAFRRRSL